MIFVAMNKCKKLILLFTLLLGIAFCSDAGVAVSKADFPSDIFRAYVLQHFDVDGDSVLSDAEVAAADSIYLYKSRCSSLKGIEHLTALKYLNCSVNGLTEIDVSHNTALTYLNIYSTYIKKLDLSANINLEKLVCSYAALDSLDVTHCTKLVELNCQLNNISELDVSKCPDLTLLNCATNALTSIDLGKNAKLRELYLFDNRLTALDVSANPKLVTINCTGNKLTSLDLGSNTRLTMLYCGENQLQHINLLSCKRLTSLYCSKNVLHDIDVTGNVYLSTFDCSSNELGSLDVSQNEDLTLLNCSGNNLATLDVSKNVTYLSTLKCDSNRLASLDLSNNRKLTTLSANGNARSVKVDYYLNASGDSVAFLTVDSLSSILGGSFDFSRVDVSSLSGGAVTTHADGRKILAFNKQSSAVSYAYSTGCTTNDKVKYATFTLKLSNDGSLASVVAIGCDRQVQSVCYYGLSGICYGSRRPSNGRVVIKVTTYSDGTRSASRVVD